MHCPNCGTDLPNNATFCPNCGTKIESSASDQAEAEQTKKPRNAKTMAIVGLVLGIVLLVVGITRFVNAFSPQQATSPASTEPTQQESGTTTKPNQTEKPSDTSKPGQDEQTSKPEQSPQPEGTEKPTTAEAPATLTDECFDEYGWVTDYAYLELSGADLVQALTYKGYQSYSTPEGNFGYLSSDGKSMLLIQRCYGDALSEDEVVKLDKNGGSEDVVCIVVSGPYDSLKDALGSMDACVLEDFKQEDGKNAGTGVVYGPSMKQNLLDIEEAENGQYTMIVYSPEALQTGIYNTVHGTSYGKTIDDIWQGLTGGYVGDYIRDHPLS